MRCGLGRLAEDVRIDEIIHANLGGTMSLVVCDRPIGLNHPLAGQASKSCTKPLLRRPFLRLSRYSPSSMRSTSNCWPANMPSCWRISAGSTIWPLLETVVTMDVRYRLTNGISSFLRTLFHRVCFDGHCARPEVKPLSRHQHNLPHQRPRLLQRVLLLQPVRGGSFGELERLADRHLQFLLAQPAIDVLGSFSLLVRRGVEHGEAEERAILDIERTD